MANTSPITQAHKVLSFVNELSGWPEAKFVVTQRDEDKLYIQIQGPNLAYITKVGEAEDEGVQVKIMTATGEKISDKFFPFFSRVLEDDVVVCSENPVFYLGVVIQAYIESYATA